MIKNGNPNTASYLASVPRRSFTQPLSSNVALESEEKTATQISDLDYLKEIADPLLAANGAGAPQLQQQTEIVRSFVVVDGRGDGSGVPVVEQRQEERKRATVTPMTAERITLYNALCCRIGWRKSLRRRYEHRFIHEVTCRESLATHCFEFTNEENILINVIVKCEPGFVYLFTHAQARRKGTQQRRRRRRRRARKRRRSIDSNKGSSFTAQR